MEFEIQRFTRKCAVTEREFRPGEVYYSALFEMEIEQEEQQQGDGVVRKDYSAEAWNGLPEGAFSYWRSRMPDADNQKVNWAPDEVMLDYFRQLESQAEFADTRYVLALLLIRRRILRMEESETTDDGEFIIATSPRDGAEHRVAVATPSPERIEEIQNALAEMLFSDSEQEQTIES